MEEHIVPYDAICTLGEPPLVVFGTMVPDVPDTRPCVPALSATARQDDVPTTDPYRSDPALVQACLEGHQWAWDELVGRYGRLVYAIARRSGLSADDADDVFQSVFLIVLRRLDSLRDQTRLSSWLITTTTRESWRARRRVATAPVTELDDAATDTLVDPAALPADDVVRTEREQLVREGMARLDDRCRELLMALFLDGSEPSYEAIAGRLDMPVGSIGPTRARCFGKLERILGELGLTANDAG